MVGTVSHLLQTMNQEVVVEGLGVLDMRVINELANQLNVVSASFSFLFLSRLDCGLESTNCYAIIIRTHERSPRHYQ